MNREERRDDRVTAIVPAFNEGPRLMNVVGPLLQSRRVDEVIVVDDGSTDDTAARLRSCAAVRLVRHRENLGKHAAMLTGATESTGSVLLFLDADLTDLASEDVDSIVTPVLDRGADMSIAYRGSTLFLFRYVFPVAPCLGGERALRKSDYLDAVRAPDAAGFRAEMVLNRYCLENRKRIAVVPLPRLGQVSKIRKYGFRKGAALDFRMYRTLLEHRGLVTLLRQIGSISLRYQLTSSPPRRLREPIQLGRFRDPRPAEGSSISTEKH